jgi:hypothetical protein
MPVEMSNVVAIRKFFELDGGRKCGLDEMKNLTPEDRKELGEAAIAELAKRGITS